MSWRTIVDEGMAHLQRAIQMDTTNPPGNELLLARYLQTVLEWFLAHHRDLASAAIGEVSAALGECCSCERAVANLRPMRIRRIGVGITKDWT